MFDNEGSSADNSLPIKLTSTLPSVTFTLFKIKLIAEVFLPANISPTAKFIILGSTVPRVIAFNSFPITSFDATINLFSMPPTPAPITPSIP